MSNNTVRQNSFETAIADLGRVVEEIEKVRLLHLMPMKLHPELNATGKAMDAIGKCIAQLNKRIEVSKKLNGKK